MEALKFSTYEVSPVNIGYLRWGLTNFNNGRRLGNGLKLNEIYPQENGNPREF